MKSINFFSLLLIISAIMFLPVKLSSQVSIGSTDTPQDFSVLELFSSGERGFRLPQLTTDQRNAMGVQYLTGNDSIAAMGLTIFNTCNLCVETWNGERWISFCTTDMPAESFALRAEGLQPDNMAGFAVMFAGTWGQLTPVNILPELAEPVFRWTSSNPAVVMVDDNGLVTTALSLPSSVAAARAVIRATDIRGGYYQEFAVTVLTTATGERVPIGGVRWATHNVDLSTFTGFAYHPTDAGMFFRWGNNRGWRSYGDPAWWDGSGWTEGGWGDGDSAHLLGIDAVWNNNVGPCPPNWRVPDETQLTNLNDTPRLWVTIWGGGSIITGNLYGHFPNQIFLPAAGRRDDGLLDRVGTHGLYWSSTGGGGAANALRLDFGWGGASNLINGMRTPGFSVRCVAEE